MNEPSFTIYRVFRTKLITNPDQRVEEVKLERRFHSWNDYKGKPYCESWRIWRKK